MANRIMGYVLPAIWFVFITGMISHGYGKKRRYTFVLEFNYCFICSITCLHKP